MPAFLANLVGGLAAWLGQWFTKKAALAMAASAAFIALTVAMWAGLKALIVGVEMTLPVALQGGIAQVIPANLPMALSIIVSAKIARTVYEWHVENLKIMSYIT